MHKCWENIYDWSEHSHRDPVANVVIYSSFAFFFGFVALGTVFKKRQITGLSHRLKIRNQLQSNSIPPIGLYKI